MFIHVLQLWNDNLKIPFAATTYKPQLVEHTRENMLQNTLWNARWSSQYELWFVLSTKISTSLATTFDCSI